MSWAVASQECRVRVACSNCCLGEAQPRIGLTSIESTASRVDLPMLVMESLFQSVQVAGNVSSHAVPHSNIGHCSEWIDPRRILDPADQVVRRIGEHPGDVGSATDTGERRTDGCRCSRYAGDGVTGRASVLPYRLGPTS